MIPCARLGRPDRVDVQRQGDRALRVVGSRVEQSTLHFSLQGAMDGWPKRNGAAQVARGVGRYFSLTAPQ